jgi:hypothetical protein
MFNLSNNIFIIYSAVLVGIAFIMTFVWYVNRMFIVSTQDLLVRFILLIFASLVGVFIVDKVIAFGNPLLSVNQNENLFDLIKTLTLMIFSYYFGTQGKKDDSE